VLKVIVQQETGNEHKGDMISATSLTSCPRKLKLSRTRNYYAEPSKLYYATRGALYHAFLEADFPDVTTEKRIFKWVRKGEHAPWLISGRLDYYDHTTKTIEDFKTMADKGTWVIFNQGVKQEYVKQLNTYRWLLHGGHLGAPDGPQIFWPVRELVIHHVFMNRVITSGKRFTETMIQVQPPNYTTYNKEGKLFRYEVPGTRKSEPYKNRPQQKKWTFDVELPKIPIYHYSTVEDWLAEDGPARLKGLMEPHHMPAGVRHDQAKEWMCDYCEVKEDCDEIERSIAVINAMKDDGLAGFIP
jgi:hypothetical protein